MGEDRTIHQSEKPPRIKHGLYMNTKSDSKIQSEQTSVRCDTKKSKTYSKYKIETSRNFKNLQDTLQ